MAFCGAHVLASGLMLWACAVPSHWSHSDYVFFLITFVSMTLCYDDWCGSTSKYADKCLQTSVTTFSMFHSPFLDIKSAVFFCLSRIFRKCQYQPRFKVGTLKLKTIAAGLLPNSNENGLKLHIYGYERI